MIIRSVVLSLLIIVPAMIALYCFANRDRLFPEMHSVVVYGRESCGITTMVRSNLRKQGIDYIFADVDIEAIHDELRYKLGPDFKEPRYTYPVVHVAGKILLTPTADDIQKELLQVQADSSRDYSTFLNGADPVPHY